jgi:C4-dicarboxylate-specific signal transduction histidine kinase
MIRLGLKTKSVLAIIAVIICFGSVASYFVFLHTRSQLETVQEDYLKMIAIDQASALQQRFSSTSELAQTIARQPAVTAFMSGGGNTANVFSILSAYRLDQAGATVSLLDVNGSVKLSTDPDLEAKNYAFRAYFQKAINGQAGYDLIFGQLSKELGYYFSYPIKSTSGEIIGVVALRYSANLIENYLERSPLNLYGHYMLTDNHGVVLRSANSSEEMRSLGRLASADRDLRDRFGDLQIGELGYEDLELTVHNYAGPSVIRQSRYNNSDAEYVFAVSKLGQLPFYLIIGEERAVFGQLSSGIAFTLSLIALVAMALIALIIYLLISAFLQPLIKLRQSITAFDSGTNQQIEVVDTNDEIGDLSRSFAQMTEHLREAISHTESKVKRRTAELRKTNQYMIGRELKMIELKKRLSDLENLLDKNYEDQV